VAGDKKGRKDDTRNKEWWKVKPLHTRYTTQSCVYGCQLICRERRDWKQTKAQRVEAKRDGNKNEGRAYIDIGVAADRAFVIKLLSHRMLPTTKRLLTKTGELLLCEQLQKNHTQLTHKYRPTLTRQSL
jgi:hypothetical protein